MRYLSFLLLVLFICQCSSSNSSEIVYAFETIIYGHVAGVNEANYQNFKIGVSTHRNGSAEAPDGYYDETRTINASGDYRFLYHSFLDDVEDIWYQASLLYIEDDEIDSVVVSKIFEANWRESPPYNSVRVDFTYDE